MNNKRRLPPKEKEKRDLEIVKLRDEHQLRFDVIAERMGLSYQGAYQAYKAMKTKLLSKSPNG